MRNLICLFVLMATAAAKPVYGDVIGSPVVNRAFVDSGVGQMFAFSGSFPSSGVVTSWSFFNNEANTSGRNIVPLLFTKTGSSYQITGIGTTRTNNAAGVQTFAFGLVSGTDVVGSNSTFGWIDGPPSFTLGVVEYSDVAPGQHNYQYFGEFNTPTLNGVYTPRNGLTRDYSIQFTFTPAVTAVPEAGTFALLGALLGLGALGMARARRRAKA